MNRVKKAQFGIRTRPPMKEKTPTSKSVSRSTKNPLTGNSRSREKKIEYSVDGSPRRVSKSLEVYAPIPGNKDRLLGLIKGKRKVKEDGKVVESQNSGRWRKKGPKMRSGGKIAPKKSSVSKRLGSAKKSIGNMRFTSKKKK